MSDPPCSKENMGRISKNIFGGDSESDSEIKTENEYAKNYDNWRKKEEFNKLRTKYGENFLEDSESFSSSDDEDAAKLTEEVEKDFFKTLSYLKKKDPKIYDSSVNFFKQGEDGISKEKKKKEEPIYLKDYERKLLLEKGGVIEDDANEMSRPTTYAEEEKHLQEEIKRAANIEDEEEDEDQLGGLLQVRNKTKEETEKEAEYLKWLTGQTDDIEDDEIKTELKPLKDFWNNPKLDSGEKFLRDYVLKKRYLDKDNEDYVPTYDEIIHDSDGGLSDDESEVDKQEEFEHKYNFRFEEPDQDFIKRYPRTIEQSLRKTDDRRKLKRAETKERKKVEKEEKIMEIKKLQELKRKEIEEKIEKLKEITGNQDVGFQEDDIDGDFDPEVHDKRMQSLFNDDFYEGAEGDQKPEFPDIDVELEIENWDHWNGEDNKKKDNTEYGSHCEDDSFNMDADYNPSTSTKKELIENTVGRKKRRRKSKVAEALSRPKPKYDPNDKNYEKYFDEYYKLDCEDIIGDVPCRFKYREVMPNDFGLTIEEILVGKDKELNRWCSLKKAVQYRPADVEKYDQIAYSRKANNINLKKRIIPSLFSEEADDDQNSQQPSTSTTQEIKHDQISGKSGLDSENNSKDKNDQDLLKTDHSNNDTSQDKSLVNSTSEKRKKKNKKKKKKIVNVITNTNEKKILSKEGNSKKKNKEAENLNENSSIDKNRKRKQLDSESKKQGEKKFKKNKKEYVNVGISDARLSAYGINPKKFKNKLKYGNNSKD